MKELAAKYFPSVKWTKIQTKFNELWDKFYFVSYDWDAQKEWYTKQILSGRY